MKYEELEKQAGRLAFKDGSSSKWDCRRLSRVQKIQLFQLFPAVKFIGLLNANEAKRFLTELN